MKPAAHLYKHQIDRIVAFGMVVILAILTLAFIDQFRGLKLSATILYFFAATMGLIVAYCKLGYTRWLNTLSVIVINFFVVLASMAEGLKTGGYLFIIPTIFGLVFMLGNMLEYKLEVITNFCICILSFAFAVLFIPDKSNWQIIADDIYKKMFITNTLTVVVLCALFAYIGIYFEQAIYAKLVDEKNKAILHEQMIQAQHDKLKDIAFMSSHIVRAPLSNILGLSALFKQTPEDTETNSIIIDGIASSAKELDQAIHSIVLKTGSLIPQQDSSIIYPQQDLRQGTPD